MKEILRVLAPLAWVSLCLVGCAHTRTYPICFYDTNLGAASATAKEWPHLKARYEAVLANAVGSNGGAVVVTSRAAVVTAPDYIQKSLGVIWPDIACYGESGGTTSAGQLHLCERYIREFIHASDAKMELPGSVTVPICQTIPSDPSP